MTTRVTVLLTDEHAGQRVYEGATVMTDREHWVWIEDADRSLLDEIAPDDWRSVVIERTD